MLNESPASIIVVDDNPTNLAVVCAQLGKCGYRLLTAENGASALRRLDHVNPDLMLLDVMMPEMDGFELAQRIRLRPDYRNQPLIFMTALDDTESKLKGFESGGVDYITKPIQYEEMIARVRTHIEVYQLRDALRHEIEAKDDLIAELEAYDMTVAHDLKNPIGGIATAVETFELMRDAELTGEEAREILEMIKIGADQAQKIIRGLLSFAQLRTKDAQRESVDMNALLQKSIERLRPMIDEFGAELVIDGSLPDAYGFGPWLEEVWANLITNAIKYGDRPARVIISGEILEESVRYRVRDNGQGLPEDRETLFKPFARSANTNTEGTGLGLSIVERIVRRHEGSVLAEDHPEGGAEISFFLPKSSSKDAKN